MLKKNLWKLFLTWTNLMIACTTVQAVTTVTPYIELGSGYNDNVTFVSENKISGQSFQGVAGLSIYKPLFNKLSLNIAGYSSIDHYSSSEIKDSSYQYASTTFFVSPVDRLSLNTKISYLYYVHSERVYNSEKYSFKPTFKYKFSNNTAGIFYYQRDSTTYTDSENDLNKNVLFGSLELNLRRQFISPYIKYRDRPSVSEVYYGLDWSVYFKKRQWLGVDIAFVDRNESNSEGSSEQEIDVVLKYSFFITKKAALNININALQAQSNFDNATDNFVASVSLSWSTKLRLFDSHNTHSSQFEKARSWYNKGAYNKAVNLCKKIIKEDPGHLETYYVLGYAYLKQNKLKEALPYLVFLYEQTGDIKIKSLLLKLY